jgi:ketosteroid isomerase-like protein
MASTDAEPEVGAADPGLSGGGPSESDVAVLRSAYAAFNERDAEAFVACFDADAYWLPTVGAWGEGRHYQGHGGVRQVLVDVVNDWREFVAEPTEFRQVGDLTLVLGRVRAVSHAGRSIDAPAAWVWEMRDGKVLRLQAYSDPAQAREALGV